MQELIISLPLIINNYTTQIQKKLKNKIFYETTSFIKLYIYDMTINSVLFICVQSEKKIINI